MTRPQWIRFTQFGAAAGVGFFAGILATSFRPANSHGLEPPPVETSCRGILAEPGHYSGRLVRLATAGMSPGPTPHELVYIRWNGMPPFLVARFADPVPVPVPRYIVGRVEVGATPPVIVVNCRPDPD